MTIVDTSEFEAISLDALRERRSDKWARYPPDVLPAHIAETDFAMAPPIKRALESAIKSNDSGYAYPRDLAPAFAQFAAERFGWIVDPDRAFAAPDVMSAIEHILECYTDAGDGVVINPPVYPPFFEVLRAARRSIVQVALTRGDGGKWSLDLDGLQHAFARGARAYVLCSPHNPVGRVWSADDLRAIAALADRYGVVVISDEIHAPLTMHGTTFTPYLSIAGENDRAFAALSATKAWNIAGLKCGLAVTGSKASADVLSSHWRDNPTELTWRIGHLGVLASIAAFREGGAWLDAMCAHLDRNRVLLKALLEEHLPKAHYVPPEAGFLTWIDCSDMGLGGDPAAIFLERGRVALSSGLEFGREGAGSVRLNMGTSGAILAEIVRRMAAAVR